MDGIDGDSVDELLSMLNLIQNMDGASQRDKRESLEKLEKLYKYSRKSSLTRKAVVEIESEIEKLKSKCQRKFSKSDDSCAEFYDLTTDKRETKQPTRYERSPSRSRYEDSKESKFYKQRFQSVDSSVRRSWTETKKKMEYALYSPRSDAISEDEDRKDRQSRRRSQCRYYKSRSRSPFARDAEREHYYHRQRDSAERYCRSHSYEGRDDYTEQPSRNRRRIISSGRSSSHERDRKYYSKYFNERIVKTEASPWDEHSETDLRSCVELEPTPENHVSSTVVDELRKKIQSTLQKASNRKTHAAVDSTRHHNLHRWQEEFELSEPSSEMEIQRPDVIDNGQVLRNDSANLAQDQHRKKFQFTFTKSMKTVTESRVSSAFDENPSDDLMDAKSKLSDLLKTVLMERNKNEMPNETAIEHTSVQERSSIDDDSVDHEIIQKIISQTQVHTSSSYKLAVNVPVGYDSAATAKMLENKLSSESQSQGYTGTTFKKSSATQIVCRNKYSSTDDHQPFLPTTTTQVLRSSNARYLTTNVNLPIPSTKFLPVPSLQKVAFSRQPVNPFKRSPLKNANDSSDQISHRQSAICKKIVPITYGEYKNQIASRELLGNYRIPKKTVQISRSKVFADDHKNRDKHKQPVSQLSNAPVVQSQSQRSQDNMNDIKNDYEDYDTHTRTILISSDSSAVERYCHETEEPIENGHCHRPMSPQSNENTTLQSDNHSTETKLHRIRLLIRRKKKM